MCVLSCFSHVWLFCNPMDCSWPDSSVHWILQARMLEWISMHPPGDLPDPGIEPMSLKCPALAGRFFTISATHGSPCVWEYVCICINEIHNHFQVWLTYKKPYIFNIYNLISLVISTHLWNHQPYLCLWHRCGDKHIHEHIYHIQNFPLPAYLFLWW